MTKANYSDKRDANEPEIVREFERLGYHVIRMARTAGFDLLCIGHGKVHIVEVKNPLSGKLTLAEDIMRIECEKHGVKYNVVYFIEDMQQVIN